MHTHRDNPFTDQADAHVKTWRSGLQRSAARVAVSVAPGNDAPPAASAVRGRGGFDISLSPGPCPRRSAGGAFIGPSPADRDQTPSSPPAAAGLSDVPLVSYSHAGDELKDDTLRAIEGIRTWAASVLIFIALLALAAALALWIGGGR